MGVVPPADDEFDEELTTLRNGLNPPRGRRFKSCQPDQKWKSRWIARSAGAFFMSGSTNPPNPLNGVRQHGSSHDSASLLKIDARLGIRADAEFANLTWRRPLEERPLDRH